MQTIAIVGGGFAGTMTAVNLWRLSDRPVRVHVINASQSFARGTAYGTPRGEHLLNVAARNMSALPDFPAHFVDWLRSRSDFAELDDPALRELFAPRRIYGDYLSGLFASCLSPIDARGEVQVETVQAEAVDIEIEDDDHAEITFADGGGLSVDRVVLATGNQAPGSLPGASLLAHDERYFGNPWAIDRWMEQVLRTPSPPKRIVLLGTGLTMVDVMLTLQQLGWEGSVVALSRNGMLPRSHFRGIAYEDYLPENAETLGLAELAELVQFHCRRLRDMSQDPAIAIDKLRPHTQRLWTSLSAEDRKLFLRRYAASWNVMRHRIAPSVHELITDALDTGRLRVIAGSIKNLRAGERGIDVQFEDSHGNVAEETGDLVINCTGPQSCLSQSGVPLFDALLRKGYARCDALDMGLEVDDQFAAIDRSGEPSNVVHAIGPLLKGSLWETTAVPELRVQAMRVAEILLQREPASLQEEEILEYYI